MDDSPAQGSTGGATAQLNGQEASSAGQSGARGQSVSKLTLLTKKRPNVQVENPRPLDTTGQKPIAKPVVNPKNQGGIARKICLANKENLNPCFFSPESVSSFSKV